MADRPPLEREFSAGGVVVRGDEVVVIRPRRRGARGESVLALPKGLIDPGESAADAAAREVREEAGVQAELVDKLGDVRYWYQRAGKRIFKVVSFFRFAYRSGDVADHDWEVEEALWLGLAEAATRLSYAGERDMVARARAALADGR